MIAALSLLRSRSPARARAVRLPCSHRWASRCGRLRDRAATRARELGANVAHDMKAARLVVEYLRRPGRSRADRDRKLRSCNHFAGSGPRCAAASAPAGPSLCSARDLTTCVWVEDDRPSIFTSVTSISRCTRTLISPQQVHEQPVRAPECPRTDPMRGRRRSTAGRSLPAESGTSPRFERPPTSFA
jgi:hypothetical protein